MDTCWPAECLKETKETEISINLLTEVTICHLASKDLFEVVCILRDGHMLAGRVSASKGKLESQSVFLKRSPSVFVHT